MQQCEISSEICDSTNNYLDMIDGRGGPDENIYESITDYQTETVLQVYTDIFNNNHLSVT